MSCIKGSKLSEEHKQKVSSYRKGKKHSLETRIKISESVKADILLKKSLGTWVPGRLGTGNKNSESLLNKRIRDSLEYKLWRNKVFERDNWACQNCGERGVKIHAHHIKLFSKYPKLRLSVKNGITLCKKCHIAVHKN